MAASAARQFLVICEVNGNFAATCTLIEKAFPQPTLQHLQVIFCVGKFFGDDSTSWLPYETGEKTWPFPTYFISGQETWSQPIDGLSQGGSISTNLHYLGDAGHTTICGFNIVFVSGTYDEQHFQRQSRNSSTTYDPFYAKSLLTDIHQEKVDVLLTCEMPVGWSGLIDVPVNEGATVNALPVTQLVSKIGPRYHVATAPQFNKFTPYVNPSKMNETWLLCLAPVISGSRTYFAANVQPLSSYSESEYSRIVPHPTSRKFPYHQQPKISSPSKVTSKPKAKHGRKRKREKSDFEEREGFRVFKRHQPADNYICKRCGSKGHWVKDCPLNEEGPPAEYVCRRCRQVGHWVYQCPVRNSYCKQSCFLCHGSSKFNLGMVILENEHTYIMCAKGPVIEEDFIVAAKQHHSSLNSYNMDLAKDLLQTLQKSMEPKSLIVVDRRYGTKASSHDFWEVFAVEPNV